MSTVIQRLVAAYLSVRTRFQRWLFGTPTRVIEWLNAALLLSWSMALLDDGLLGLPVYSALHLAAVSWANEALSLLFFLAASFAGAGAVRSDGGADKLAGYGLQLGAVLWCAVAINFLAAFPPINTGVAAYGLLAFFCWSAGGFLWERGCDRHAG